MKVKLSPGNTSYSDIIKVENGPYIGSWWNRIFPKRVGPQFEDPLNFLTSVCLADEGEFIRKLIFGGSPVWNYLPPNLWIACTIFEFAKIVNMLPFQLTFATGISCFTLLF